MYLEGQEAQHCSRVLRKEIGDELFVTNGKGMLYKTTIASIDKEAVCCDILESNQKAQEEQLILAVVPTKNRDRLEWMVEKLVEMGVKQIILLKSQHAERSKINMERLQKKAVSAMKQSLRLHLPSITSLNFQEVLELSIEQKFIAHCHAHMDRQAWTAQQTESILLIGPEGDFSEEEVEQAISKGYSAIELGEARLRTETAALQACAQFHYPKS